MQDPGPSATALGVAARRAAHQWLDHPRVFEDPLALRILPPELAAHARRTPWMGMPLVLRAILVARSRFAEDELTRARARGTRQYVILGAGLDTFAYRRRPGDGDLQVFEVDHPATQAWKRRRLSDAGIPVPDSVHFVPVDFETASLGERLAQAGLDRGAPTFFAWLGVTMYLTRPSIARTLEFAGSTGSGGGIVLDYLRPRAALDLGDRIGFDLLARWVAQRGEPLRTTFEAEEIGAVLRGAGFGSVVDLGRDEINERYFRDRSDRLRVRGSVARMLSARL
jgi:methyltransferase (TIGR00027 family)